MISETWMAAAVPIIVAIVQLAKRSGFPSRWSGLLAVGLGLIGGLGSYGYVSADWRALGMIGLVAGLAAAGLYSTGKNAAGK